MRLIIAAIGRLKAGAERELLERYIERSQALGRAAGLTSIAVWEAPEGRGRTPEERKRAEGRDLLNRVEPGSTLVVFDERGRSMSSLDFAATIARARDGGTKSVALVIGGPDGLSEDVRASSNLSFAFGAATLPHQLVRILVAEQLYRALTVLSGHPYHRP